MISNIVHTLVLTYLINFHLINKQFILTKIAGGMAPPRTPPRRSNVSNHVFKTLRFKINHSIMILEQKHLLSKLKDTIFLRALRSFFSVIQITTVDILFRSKLLFQHSQITITFQQKFIFK